jgi:anthranilate synthase component 1
MTVLKVLTKVKLADTETPVSAYMKLGRERNDSFLLESAETHETVGRWSIIAFDPLLTIELWPGRIVIEKPDGREELPDTSFFETIRDALKAFPVEEPGLPAAVGSLMGFIGYDAVRLIERLGPPRPTELPIARLALPSRYVLFDHLRRTMTLAALARDEVEGRAKIEETEGLLGARLEPVGAGRSLELQPPDRDRFQSAVERAKEYIRAGDIFQAVLAGRFEGRTGVPPLEVYRRLRVKNPSPYMFFMNFDGYALLGASPETLVKVDGENVIVRPIAGTRGRSDDPARDRELEREMTSSGKELAEHVMLVDLGRNDVGRVSRWGTVRVDPYMSVERYSHVMHIVSQVHGRLREDADAVEAFKAGFPAGTVSGAPKVRAMEIIDELEHLPRGPYGGAVGYFGPHNRMDTCIAIRMMLFQGDSFTVPVGAGIVADSIPEMEFKEINNKAAGSLAALRAAVEGEL